MIFNININIIIMLFLKLEVKGYEVILMILKDAMIVVTNFTFKQEK